MENYMKYCVLTTAFDQNGRPKNSEYEFDTSLEADEFIKSLPATLARQRYIKEVSQKELAVV